MNILQISAHDYGGCAYYLAEAIKRHTDHSAMAVRQTGGSYIGYQTHLVAPQPDDLIGVWNWADVVHVHDILPKLPRGAPPKPTMITYHGSMYRRSPETYHKYVADRGWLPTVATIDLTLLGGWRWMPDCRPDFARYVGRPKGRFIVAHAPTSRVVKDTDKVVAQLAHVEGVILDIIEGVSYEECLTRKGRASVYVDQFRLCYGLNAIEAWRMGMPVLANAGKETLEQIKALVGHLPFVRCTAGRVRSKVLQLRDDPRRYAEALEMGRDVVERFHTQQAAARIAMGFYDELLQSTPLPRRKQQISASGVATPPPGHDGMVLLRYLDSNVGKVPFTCPTTGQTYTFSALDPVKYVDIKDAPWLLGLSEPIRRGRGSKRQVSERKLFEEVR